MTQHPALASGRVAVITGGASGIGLAAARRFVALGMRVCIVDRTAGALEEAARELERLAGDGAGAVMATVADVRREADMLALRDRVHAAWGEVGVLMNNAGIEPPSSALVASESWRDIIDTNLWGVIHGTHAFAQAMAAQGTPCAIINTGSKQGITCPPGNPAYNISKAGVKVFSEALAHELRSGAGPQVSVHLLVPGFTFTGLTRATEKPAGAWTPGQVVDFMIERMAAGDFYIICPDNEVTREIDNRMTWAMQDVTENRPPLSRWHPDYAEAFRRFMES
jgi:NAD(P)-dependent dehydrogenase (short-subunit alcohol dehydrogenase family)